MTPLFVSDLHLDAARPAATDRFLQFLAGPAREAGSLYILGDLFETWTGDDSAGLHEQGIMAALRRYTDAGCACHFLRGNRDFLVGQRFAGLTGAALLPDETLIDLEGQAVLLMHGDTLCTDDRAYQRYRRIVHQPLIQKLFLGLPAGVRAGIARRARHASTTANARKPPEIMDVNPAAVTAALRRHGVALLIHGHTHRPGIHTLDLDGRVACRVVLGAWYEEGTVLHWTGQGPELHRLAFGG